MSANTSITGTQAKLLDSVGDKVVTVMTPMLGAVTTQLAMIDAKLEAFMSRIDTLEAMMGPNCKTDTHEKKQVADGGDAPAASAQARAPRSKKAAPAAAPVAAPPAAAPVAAPTVAAPVAAPPVAPPVAAPPVASTAAGAATGGAASAGAASGGAADGGKRTANAKLWFRDNFAPNLEQYFKQYDTPETRAGAVANSKAMASEKPDSDEYMKKLALYIWDSVLDEEQKKDVKLKRIILDEARNRATTTPQLDTDYSA